MDDESDEASGNGETPGGGRATDAPEATQPDLGELLSDVESADGTDTPGVAAAGDSDDDDPGVDSSRAVRVLGGDDPDVDLESLPDQSTIREAILSDVQAHFADHDGRFDAPDDSFLEESFFDFSYLDRYEEVERTWVNEPFAYVSVLYDPVEREYRYRVGEPELDEFEQYVRRDLVEYLRNSLMYQDIGGERTKEEVFEEDVLELVARHARSVEPGSIHKLAYYLRRDFVEFGPIDPIMRDPAVEDVSCDGADVPVYVYHRGYRDLRTNVSFDAERLSSFTVRLAQRAGKQISVSDPLLDATLPDGSRLQLTMGGEVATRGSNFTIRKFSDVPFSPVDLVNWNTFSVEQMAYFWLAIESNKSLVFAGGTGSGKTSSMNAVSFFIPPSSKVVSIEDTREIDLPHDNWIQSVTRDSASGEGRGEVSMYALLQSALRQRPEYILVGEIRTEERVALTFFQAMGTGHTAYTTMHADSIDTVLNRLQNPPLSVPRAMIQDLDIVSIQRQTFVEDGRVRRNQQVTEMRDPPEDDPMALRTRNVFERNAREDVHQQVNESTVLADIAEERGWTGAELDAEMARREGVLRFMLEEEVLDYRDVAAVLQLYAKDPEYVVERVRARGYDLPQP
ncbi:type II/IV secretion system ATPase subunit [Halorarius halobius]|uniref:type II/IV secretion system ATPase subunit n=1 Tax=Halorarius halobius TaxID=2962671 RepID=UPI0020CF5954|nr:type II/IV secretion system ATPase subunit [Halorarius halobius]